MTIRKTSFALTLKHAILSLSAMAIATFSANAPAKADDTIYFGVIPLESQDAMREKFTPLAEFLSEEIGQPVQIVVGKDYQATMDDMGSGAIQIAYLTPTTYPKSDRQNPDAGITPLVKFESDGEATYRSYVIANPNAGIETLADIKGRKFAFGSEDSTSSHLMPRSLLVGAGLDIDKDLAEYKFTGSHSNAAKAVALGVMDAGGVKQSVAEEFANEGKVKIVAKSGDIPEFPICVNRHLPTETAEKIKAALLKLDPANEEHNKVLTSIDKKYTGAEPALSEDYDIIREMVLKLYGEEFYAK